ncbi:MAG: aminotransferase class III-fold pyridoxal phosphate-dependent enzyme [Planctomycetes bacterium]|nr:aminotransferase class III-fold pyridoxal phosphate-dependent enzyme [Planctomycetota bacterium]
MTEEELRRAEDKLLLPTFARWPLSIVRGRGVHVWDSTGRKYLDLYGGHAVASTGHCHPRVVAALERAARELLFYSTTAYHPARLEVARLLVCHAPAGVDRVFFTNSGAEANEAAMKLVRMKTGRDVVVSFEGSFHGRTLGALSATGILRYRTDVGPLVPGHRIVPWMDPDAVDAIDGSVAAVLLEPIQSMAGVRPASPEWLASLRRRCDETGAVLIFDEIQTGLGRTGHFFSHDWAGVAPDVLTLAKGIASGFPFAATIASRRLAEGLKAGDFGSTFGGGPLASAVAAETLRVIEDEGLAENAGRVGTWLAERLAALSGVAEVRGKGLLLGVRLRGLEGREAAARFREAGVLLGTSSDPAVLRLLPPLTLTQADCETFLAVAERILA